MIVTFNKMLRRLSSLVSLLGQQSLLDTRWGRRVIRQIFREDKV